MNEYHRKSLNITRDHNGEGGGTRTRISNNSELPMLLNTYSKAHILVHTHLYLDIGKHYVQIAYKDLIWVYM